MIERKQRVTRVTASMTAALAALALTLSSCNSTDNSNNPSGSGGSPVRGGEFTIGSVGGSAKDTLDAKAPYSYPDMARVLNLYDTLVTFDPNHKIEMDLADKVTPSKDGKTWTVHLRSGLKFSDGSPITADDVVFTFYRLTNPDDPGATASSLKTLDREGLRADGDQTVIFPFTKPYVDFLETMAQYGNGIVPKGYDPKKPVSSGPFMLQSFTPGQQSVFVRNPNYWREGQPYLDKLTIIDFPDDTARVNALLGGQVDAIDSLPYGQVNVVKGNPNLAVLESPTGKWLPFTMRTDVAPFDDPRVRQAFRLIVDRQQMIDQALAGHGTLGNDMYGKLDPCYPTDVPQREQDIAKAKELLAEAGQSNLTVELVTSNIATGVVEAAQVFAQQAKEAGVTVNVRKVDSGEFFGDNYLKWPFAQDFWNYRGYLAQASQGSVSTAPYNETHWNDPEFQALVDKASETVDENERCNLIQQAEAIEYDKGGYIIWGFPNSVDAYSRTVHGLVKDNSGLPLSRYNFRNVWIGK